MDPKKTVEGILGALRAKGLKGKKLWARVCDFGNYLEDTVRTWFPELSAMMHREAQRTIEDAKKRSKQERLFFK